MALARVQASAKATQASAASITFSVATPPTVGNALLVFVNYRGATTYASTCTDNRSNTYTRAVEQKNGTRNSAIFVCTLVAATGSPFQITVTVAGLVTGYWVAQAVEYSGVGTGLIVDQTAGAFENSTTPATGVTAPLGGAEVILAACHAIGIAQTAITVAAASPSWAQEFEELPSTYIAGEANTRIVSAAAGTTPSCSWTDTASSGWTAVLAAFRATAPVVPVPTLTSVAPATGVPGATVVVTLTGTNFVAGSTTVAVSGAGVTVSGVSVGSATTLTASLAIAGSAAAGARSVTVTTAGGTSGAQTFTITPPVGTSLLIGGRETTETDLRAGSLRCELLLDTRGKLACQLIDPPVIPTIGMDVLFTLAGVPFFGGIVVESTQTDAAAWSLTASDNLAILDGILTNDVSPAGTLLSVLNWMMSISLGAYGFTVDPAQAAGPLLPSLAWPFQSYAEAFKQLGILTGWTSRVSPTRVVRFYPGGAVPAPWTIDDAVVQSLTTRQSREGHASGVWVRFGSGAPSDVTWSTVGNGTAVSWIVPYYVATPPNVVIVNATTFPVFAYPGPGWTWEATSGEGVIHAPPGDPPLTASDTITVTLTAAWPGVRLARTYASPPIEVVVDYPDVFDAAVAQTLADGELARREGHPRRFALRTAKVGLLPGQSAALDVPQLGLSTTALITGVRLTHATTLQASGAIWWALVVELVEANASRGNWLTYWMQVKGGATGGGTGSSVTGTIPPVTPPTPGGGGAAYVAWPLGGDHDNGYTGTAFTPIPNACLVDTPPSFTGRVWTIHATVKRLLGTGTFQLALSDLGGTNIATSAVNSADFASLVFTAPVVPGTTYVLRGACSDGSTLFGTTGYLEAVQP